MSETEWFEGKASKNERRHLTVWVGRVLVCLAVLVAVAIATNAFADEILFRAEQNGVVIKLFKDKCTVPAVSNLPYKATWEEKGRTYVGCFGANPEAGIVMMYFADDKTVAVVPFSAFTRAQGA